MDLVVFTEANSTQTQHVNRKSSDELLRKFADPDVVVDESKSTKRRKKSATMNSRETGGVDVESNTIGFVERKRLLLALASKRRSLFLRQIASGKSHLRNKSLVRTIGKTWRKTMEGASRVFIDKHYNRHRRHHPTREIHAYPFVSAAKYNRRSHKTFIKTQTFLKTSEIETKDDRVHV